VNAAAFLPVKIDSSRFYCNL